MADKTYIIISTLRKFKEELNAYMSQFINPLQIVSMVENWMIHGSDHWFIKPSIWNKIEDRHRPIILEEILEYKFNIGSEFRLSIFNDLKNESIKLMEKNYSMLNDKLIELLNKEKSKITSADISG